SQHGGASSALSQEKPAGVPDKLRGGLEQLSGMDLSGVRVHYDSPKPAQLDALAYTHGKNIYIGPGQEKHLPHEAWHVVQQGQGRVAPPAQAKGAAISDDPGLEAEADIRGARGQSVDRAAPRPHAAKSPVASHESAVAQRVKVGNLVLGGLATLGTAGLA